LMNWWLICGWVALTPTVFAASQMDSVTIGYSSFAGAYGPLWIAVEEQLGKKHGLELKAIYAGRIRPQQILASAVQEMRVERRKSDLQLLQWPSVFVRCR
jgi:methylmalonyl-CoA mutase cobalamin-binding subunit